MPCYTPQQHIEYVEVDNPKDKVKIERLTSQKRSLEAGLCAIITELEKRGIADEVISQASKSGLINLMDFWVQHSKQDETRLSRELHNRFSEHEQEILKRILNSK